jgi:hypothetical protein
MGELATALAELDAIEAGTFNGAGLDVRAVPDMPSEAGP